MRLITSVLVLCTLVLATGASAQQPPAAAQPPQRGIVNVTGQLYRAQNNNHYTVFLVTPEGNPPLPADAVKIDANRNGPVERSEAAGAYSERFALFDYNRDDVLSGAGLRDDQRYAAWRRRRDR